MIDTVFLDRDGVINEKPEEDDYVTSWEGFRFLPRSVAALRLLSGARLRLVVVSNQRGVARGRMAQSQLDEIHHRMLGELSGNGVTITAVYACPHEIGTCPCRKPETGLFERAREEVPGLDFERSAMVGDSAADIEAANRIGARSLLVAPTATRPQLVAQLRERGLRVDGNYDDLYDATVRELLPAAGATGDGRAPGLQTATPGAGAAA